MYNDIITFDISRNRQIQLEDGELSSFTERAK